MDAMDIDNEMNISDDEASVTIETTAECEKSQTVNENEEKVVCYVEAADSWLRGLKWKPYPPLLGELKAFGEEPDEDYDDIDISEGLVDFLKENISESVKHTAGATDKQGTVPRPTIHSSLLQHDFDYREFIFTILQRFASTRKTFIGPLTSQAVSSLADFSATLIDDALSGGEDRICQALTRLLGDLHSRELTLGEVIDERRWDVAEDIAVDCVNFMTSCVAQEVDFYTPQLDRADPIFSMILAETDWLLYEMVCCVSDEHADLSSYDEHFYGPSEEEKKKRRALELQMKKEQEEKQKQMSSVPIIPVVTEVYQPLIPPVTTEHHFGYNYIPPPQEAPYTDPNLWQNYLECQQQTAYVQAAAYSITAKMRAQYVASQAQASLASFQQKDEQPVSVQNTVPLRTKTKSLAVKFVQSALKTKGASNPPQSGSSSRTSSPTRKADKLEQTEREADRYDRNDRNESSRSGSSRHRSDLRESSRDRRDGSHRRRSGKRRHEEEGDDERQDGPFYCMVTNVRSGIRASEVERALDRVGRIDSVRVLRDKAARPPDNSLASVTFRYVYKSAFEKLLSSGLYMSGKYRPTARLQSDPFSSS